MIFASLFRSIISAIEMITGIILAPFVALIYAVAVYFVILWEYPKDMYNRIYGKDKAIKINPPTPKEEDDER